MRFLFSNVFGVLSVFGAILLAVKPDTYTRLVTSRRNLVSINDTATAVFLLLFISIVCRERKNFKRFSFKDV